MQLCANVFWIDNSEKTRATNPVFESDINGEFTVTNNNKTKFFFFFFYICIARYITQRQAHHREWLYKKKLWTRAITQLILN